MSKIVSDKSPVMILVALLVTNGLWAKNAPNIPVGQYQRYCDGCTLKDGVLTCSSCVNDDGNKRPSSIKVNTCKANEEIIDNDGTLDCNPR